MTGGLDSGILDIAFYRQTKTPANVSLIGLRPAASSTFLYDGFCKSSCRACPKITHIDIEVSVFC
jgi:hypothetical protein